MESLVESDTNLFPIFRFNMVLLDAAPTPLH